MTQTTTDPLYLELLVSLVEQNSRFDYFSTRSVLRALRTSPFAMEPGAVAKMLQMNPAQVAEDLDYLASHKLVEKDRNPHFQGYSVTQRGEDYLNGTSKELWRLAPTWEKLTRPELSNMLTVLELNFEFSYEKNFEVTDAQLQPLLDDLKSDIEKLNAKTQDYMKNLTGTLNSEHFNISAVSFRDPLWADGAGHQTRLGVSAGVTYPTFSAALDDDVRRISGLMKSNFDEKLKEHDSRRFHLGFSAYESRVGHTIYFNAPFGTGSDFWTTPLEYQRACIEEAKSVMAPVLNMYVAQIKNE